MSGIVGSYFNIKGSGIVAKLGTDGQIFTSTGAGLSQGFEAAAGGGKIGQVVQTVNTSTETRSSTTAATISNFTVAITPVATSSKILVFVDAKATGHDGRNYHLQLFRDTTQIYMGDAAGSRARIMSGQHVTGANARYIAPDLGIYIDSPSTTSEVEYSLKWFTEASEAAYLNRTALDNDAATYDPRCASAMTVMEVLA